MHLMNILSRACQSFCGHHSQPVNVEKLTRGLSFSGPPFPFHKRLLQRIGRFV